MQIDRTIAGTHSGVFASLVHGLEIEFGEGAGQALAQRFIEAEESDFLWDARVSERWLGGYECLDADEGIELDRVAVVGRLGRRWFAATVIVNGDGEVVGLIARRDFARRRAAEQAYARAH
ncbi:hypothetical protein [Novosphingobium sp. RL4]|uniref:hypothetical protein n=1 Tax=Novosphingobium sp. RL4 TaxID=3109595 RepID=UPI002D79864A|nr:hypothetical protein [Novosphingobium sp. RL4]WRT94486.1 hypothetical protein U9J33_08285 [Novosphingobium sp. RL4]